MSAADHVFDRYSTVTRPLLDRYVRYTAVRALGAAITPLCFYVLGAFLPSVPGRARNADHLIKTPPEGALRHTHRVGGFGKLKVTDATFGNVWRKMVNKCG